MDTAPTIDSGTSPRRSASRSTEVDAAGLRRIGLALSAVTATVTMLALIAVVSN